VAKKPAKAKVEKEPVIEGQTPLEKRKALQEKLRLAINKQYGSGTASIASSREYIGAPRISSGSFSLDHALGGGWPRGRVCISWGQKSSNKTTAYVRAVADAQQRDSKTNKYIWAMTDEEKKDATPCSCVWLDPEGTFMESWAEGLGVDLDSLLLVRPESQEECIDVLDSLTRSGLYDVLVLDSLAAMTPVAEIEGAAGDHHVGLAARKNNMMFRKLQAGINMIAKEEKRIAPTLLIVNQVRQKIGVMFGDNKVKPGGFGQDFYSSVEVFFWASKLEYWDADTKKVPKTITFNFKIEKNKVSAPRVHGSYQQALSDHPKEQWKLGDVIEISEVMDFAGKIGIYREAEDEKGKKTWVMYDEIFTRKKDVMEKYCLDNKNFTLLKQDLMIKMFPKQ
jgi:recombination protein RecA